MTLEYLNFSESNFQRIEEGAFNSIHFAEMKFLVIEKTPINILSKESFIGLTNLMGLILCDVQLHTVEPNVLAPLPNIEMFELTRCGNTTLRLDNFFATIELLRLEEFEIHKCNLGGTITKSAFSGLRVIKSLSLRENEITKIEPDSFDAILMTIKCIDLRDNKLNSLTPNIYKLSSDIWFKIGNISWHCDCDLESLRKYIQKTENQVFDEIHVSSSSGSIFFSE